MILADTDIRFTVKTTVQSVMWVGTDIRLTVKTTVQSVIRADEIAILGHYFDVVSLGKALYHHMLLLTQM